MTAATNDKLDELDGESYIELRGEKEIPGNEAWLPENDGAVSTELMAEDALSVEFQYTLEGAVYWPEIDCEGVKPLDETDVDKTGLYAELPVLPTVPLNPAVDKAGAYKELLVLETALLSPVVLYRTELPVEINDDERTVDRAGQFVTSGAQDVTITSLVV